MSKGFREKCFVELPLGPVQGVHHSIPVLIELGEQSIAELVGRSRGHFQGELFEGHIEVFHGVHYIRARGVCQGENQRISGICWIAPPILMSSVAMMSSRDATNSLNTTTRPRRIRVFIEGRFFVVPFFMRVL